MPAFAYLLPWDYRHMDKNDKVLQWMKSIAPCLKMYVCYKKSTR